MTIYCNDCISQIKQKYNPFSEAKNISAIDNDDSDLFYNQDTNEFTGDIQEASNILENCTLNKSKSLNLLFKEPQNKFNLFFYNVDGNKTNFDTLAAELSTFKDTFSVIGIAETNTDPNNKDLYPLTNYTSFYNEKLPNKQSGTGVAMYIHNSFNATVNEHASAVLPCLESLFLKVTKGEETVNVGVIYRSPNSNFTEFINEFSNLVESLPKTPTFIMGDFNVDLLKDNSNTQTFEELFITQGLFPVISIATHRHSDQKGSCIDNIFTNRIETIQHSGVVCDQGSAHSPIYTTSSIDFKNGRTQQEKTTQYYSFSRNNTDKLVKTLRDNQTRLAGNISDFLSTYKQSTDICCKLSVPKTTRRNAINNPWINDSIIASIEEKQILYKEWKKSCTPKNIQGNKHLYDKYSKYRRCLKHIISAVKAKHYNNKFDKAAGNPKKTWEIINHIRGKQKCPIKPQFKIDNKRIIERRIIANEFNKYFVSIASKLNDRVKIEPLPKRTFRDFMSPNRPQSMVLHDCTQEEVSDIIHDLQNGKASDIPISVIKKTSSVIVPTLTMHFNHLMKTGYFPDELKTGNITPIYKKDDKELMQNYRPVSTLPIFGKIFEKVIYSRLYSYFTSQGILYEKQFGFRKGHSTSHALNYSVNEIKNARKNGNHVMGIFIDLSKAFDTIDHFTLLEKLNSYGVRGIPHSLITSYITNRKQYVTVLNECSDQLPVTYGVPQGSCLGPLLFLIYINDLGYLSNQADFILFADDTNIFLKANSKVEVFENANQILKLILSYMTCNKLHINLGKSVYMYFPPLKNVCGIAETPNPPVKIGDDNIKSVKKIKFLGVVIDDKLTWEPHIKALTKKLASCTGSLNRISESIPKHLHKDLYHTLFESHLTYGITVWGGSTDSKLFPLFKAQKKVMRVLFGDKEKFLDKFRTCARTRQISSQKLTNDHYIKEHTKPIFNKHSFLTLKNLYFYHCATETYKILKFRSPSALLEQFTFSNRSHKDLFIRTPQPSDAFIYRASVIWNNVREVLNIRDGAFKVSSLKEGLKTYLLRKQTSGDNDTWIDCNFMSAT